LPIEERKEPERRRDRNDAHHRLGQIQLEDRRACYPQRYENRRDSGAIGREQKLTGFQGTQAAKDERSPAGSFLAESIALANEFQSVAEGVGGVKSPSIWQSVVPNHLKTGVSETLRQSVEVLNAESRVRLPLRGEFPFNAEMEDGATRPKPAPAATGERLRLHVLAHAEDIGEKGARLALLPRRHRQLNMVQTGYHIDLFHPPRLFVNENNRAGAAIAAGGSDFTMTQKTGNGAASPSLDAVDDCASAAPGRQGEEPRIPSDPGMGW
jgi:hypothetical protein